MNANTCGLFKSVISRFYCILILSKDLARNKNVVDGGFFSPMASSDLQLIGKALSNLWSCSPALRNKSLHNQISRFGSTLANNPSQTRWCEHNMRSTQSPVMNGSKRKYNLGSLNRRWEFQGKTPEIQPQALITKRNPFLKQGLWVQFAEKWMEDADWKL